VANNKADQFLNATVFPNPSSSTFNLKIESSTTDKAEIMVYDLVGKPVTKLMAAPGETVSLGNNWASGTYIIEIRQGTQRKVLKVIRL
jgi:hypothetical protein